MKDFGRDARLLFVRKKGSGTEKCASVYGRGVPAPRFICPTIHFGGMAHGAMHLVIFWRFSPESQIGRRRIKF